MVLLFFLSDIYFFAPINNICSHGLPISPFINPNLTFQRLKFKNWNINPFSFVFIYKKIDDRERKKKERREKRDRRNKNRNLTISTSNGHIFFIGNSDWGILCGHRKLTTRSTGLTTYAFTTIFRAKKPHLQSHKRIWSFFSVLFLFFS
jgi:hypothetical protein